jgi:hypothetical protein
MEKAFRAAVRNVATHGDTDVFPYPIENHIFYDYEDKAVELLLTIHQNFKDFLLKYPPVNAQNLAVVGYTGLRWATQIDPIWNAYLLGLVIAIGDDIEKARVPADKETVFSYRFNYDATRNTVFDRKIGWPEFQQTSIKRSKEFSHVLICDIADFYPRIYHHRLENALSKATSDTETPKRIMELLKRISQGVSYGLPIGGPAARLLSELLLNRVDRLLMTNGITFCRYSDDYHLFASSEEQCYTDLLFLSEKLLENEGLSLQKSKTRIMSSEEFLSLSEVLGPEEPREPKEAKARQFLSLRLRYDPYSQTADEDYKALKKELKKFDIVGMLTREIGKTRIHQALTRRLIGVVRHLEPSVLNDAIRTLIDNPSKLYPVFPSVMILLKSALNDIDEETRLYVFEKLKEMINNGNRATKAPINLCYALRVLAEDDSEEAEAMLVKLYTETTNIIIKRDIILIMAKRNADFWISDAKKRYGTLTIWEKRSLIIASFILGDEGVHWRNQMERQISPIDVLSRFWAAKKMKKKGWSIPI